LFMFAVETFPVVAVLEDMFDGNLSWSQLHADNIPSNIGYGK